MGRGCSNWAGFRRRCGLSEVLEFAMARRLGAIDFLRPRPPQGLPPATWNLIWPYRIVGLTAALGLILAGLLQLGVALMLAGKLSPRLLVILKPWVMPLAVSSIILLAVAHRLAIRALARILYKRSWAVCMACGYSLQGLPESYRCPECGTSFELHETRSTWQAALDDFGISLQKQPDRTGLGDT
jgi:hypothetical protein